jgi:hypothetical protein
VKQFSSIVKHDSTSDADDAQQWIGKRSSYPIPSVPEPKSSITRATDSYLTRRAAAPFTPLPIIRLVVWLSLPLLDRRGGVRHIVLLGPDAGE